MPKAQKGSGSQELIPTIQNIIARQLKIKPSDVRLEAHLQKDLGAESLDALEIIMYIEEAFDIRIPDEEARKAGTVEDIANYVSKMIKKP